MARVISTRYKILNTASAGTLGFFVFLPILWILIPIYLIFRDIGLLDTRVSLVFVLTMINLPIIIWMLYTYFKEIPA